MPPRYSYWTILAGGLPTAFRSADREELAPTFQRIREKHPDAEMKWFARGKLWDSPEAASARRDARDAGPSERPRDRPSREPEDRPRRRDDDRGTTERRPEARGRDWRPGGQHQDPRQKYKDAKKARNLDHRKEKFARKQTASPQRGARDESPR